MLGWALTFFILAVVAAYLGFFALAGTAALLAKLFLGVFAILLVVSVAARVRWDRFPPEADA